MEIQPAGFYPLFAAIKIAVDRDKEIQLQNQDKFNVFEILKLEANETRTHSAFIGELLNPAGSHLMKDAFLKAFLETINREDKFNIDAVSVRLEGYIGAVSMEKLKGGRVDIIISNRQQSLCIENKIYASLQPEQLKRYINYNRPNNYVLYLTLNTHDLEMEAEYEGLWENISYKNHILPWLDKCYHLAISHPILRETIKQYIQLIERLTGMLINKSMNDNVSKTILENLSAAKVIAENYARVTDILKIGFQEQVFQILKLRNQSKWNVEIGNRADQINAQIWIKPPGNSRQLWFGIETFSGRGHFSNEFIQGIISVKEEQDRAAFEELFANSSRKGVWYDHEILADQEKTPINFTSPDLLARISRDVDYRDKLAEHIAEGFLSYFNQRRIAVEKLLKIN